MKYGVVFFGSFVLAACGGAGSSTSSNDQAATADIKLAPVSQSTSVEYSALEYEGEGTVVDLNKKINGTFSASDDRHLYNISASIDKEILVVVESDQEVSMTIPVYNGDDEYPASGYLGVDETEFGYYRLTPLPDNRYEIIVVAFLEGEGTASYTLTLSEVARSAFNLEDDEYLISEELNDSTSCQDSESSEIYEDNDYNENYSVLNIKNGYIRSASELSSESYLLASASSAGFVIDTSYKEEGESEEGIIDIEVDVMISYTFNSDFSGGNLDGTIDSYDNYSSGRTVSCTIETNGVFTVEF